MSPSQGETGKDRRQHDGTQERTYCGIHFTARQLRRVLAAVEEAAYRRREDIMHELREELREELDCELEETT